MSRRFFGLVVLSALLAGSCGGDHSEHSGGDDATASEAGTKGVVLGAAAESSEADKEIIVTASDALSFDPSTVDVSAGEVVTFVIKNTGQNVHEFVLGDEAYQAEHEKEMQGEHHMTLENAVTIEPGQTEELTWEFTEDGSLQYGCHEPGHYEGGMFGTIEIG